MLMNTMIFQIWQNKNLGTFDRKLASKMSLLSTKTLMSCDEAALPNRRSANYKPPIWDFDFVQSLSSEYMVIYCIIIMEPCMPISCVTYMVLYWYLAVLLKISLAACFLQDERYATKASELKEQVKIMLESTHQANKFARLDLNFVVSLIFNWIALFCC